MYLLRTAKLVKVVQPIINGWVAHLRINILTAMGEQTKAWLGIFGSALLFWMFAVLAWRVSSAAVVAQGTERATPIHELPFYPFYWVICGILCICSLNQLIVSIGDVVRADKNYDQPQLGKSAQGVVRVKRLEPVR